MSAPDSDLTMVKETSISGKPIYQFTCRTCGKEARNSYMEPIGSRMLANRQCFYCDFDGELTRNLEKRHATLTIIDGHIYTPGNRTSGEFRGMAGRRFDIEYIEPSVYAGQRCTTFDLWSGSTLTDGQRVRFSDTAVFLEGAKRFPQDGDRMGCWNGSSSRSEPYPLPKLLVASSLFGRLVEGVREAINGETVQITGLEKGERRKALYGEE